MEELGIKEDNQLAHHTQMAFAAVGDGKTKTRLLAAMMYALERGRDDPEWAENLKTLTQEQMTKQQKLEFMSLVAKECRIPGLTNQEKEEWVAHDAEQILAYFISRTKIIGEFPKGVERLQHMQEWQIGLQMGVMVIDFQRKFVELMSQHAVCQRYEEVSTMGIFRSQNRKDSPTRKLPSSFTYELANPNQKFVSIDMKTGNFSVFFHFWGHHCLGLEPEFESWEDLARTITDNPFLVSSKELRGSSFGKLVKSKKLLLEQTMTYLMGLIYDKLIDKGYKVVMFNLDEVVIEGEGSSTELSELVKELESHIGKYMIERFRFEPFTLEKVETPNGKTLIRKRIMGSPCEETRVYNMDPKTAAAIYASKFC